MSFNQEFIIHPVGQGLFYSGKITHNNIVKFRMVFDCGSLTSQAGIEEVNIYREDTDFLDTKILDLLVISHFDADHVNHIGRLLAGGIKIKKLVMPLVTFEERLFLVTRYIEENNGYPIADDFYPRFTLDPIGSLNDNLDGDSEVLLIEGEPDSQIPPDKEVRSTGSGDEKDEERFLFDFENSVKVIVQSNEINTSKPKGQLFKINHNNKATVKSGRLIYLMEFLFYRRKITNDNFEFFEKIKELFYREFLIATVGISEEIKLERIKETIKSIGSATRIKKIYREAKKALRLKSKKGELVITDLNTTALCLLHKNLKGIIQLIGLSQEDNDHRWHIYDNSYVYQIQNFFTDTPARSVNLRYYDEFHHLRKRNRLGYFHFPNTMLTADSFLLTLDQVKEFLNHYKYYWTDFWLFQIPHHGSDKSSNQLLHSNIPYWTFNFINYGIENKHSHPSAKVINDLVATGNSLKLIPINEYQGIRFGLILRNHNSE